MEPRIQEYQPDGWEKAYAKLFWVIVAGAAAVCGYAFASGMVEAIAESHERGTLATDAARVSLPVSVVAGLWLIGRWKSAAINGFLKRGRLHVFLYFCVVGTVLYFSFAFAHPRFLSWEYRIWPLMYAGVMAALAKPESS